MYLITLQLIPPDNTLEHVRRIRGLDEIDIDQDYGIVSISPKRNLYVIRVKGDIDVDRIRGLPEVKGVHGDVKIAPIDEGGNNQEE
jgi:hypothetical protein